MLLRLTSVLLLLACTSSSLNSDPLSVETPSQYRPPSYKEEEYSVCSLPFSHGTTTLGFTFYRPISSLSSSPYSLPLRLRSSLLIAVDSRSSISSYVSSSTVQKVVPLSSTVLATIAGGAADCQQMLGLLRRRIALHRAAAAPFDDSSSDVTTSAAAAAAAAADGDAAASASADKPSSAAVFENVVRPSSSSSSSSTFELPLRSVTSLLSNALDARRPRGAGSEGDADGAISVGTIVAGYEIPSLRTTTTTGGGGGGGTVGSVVGAGDVGSSSIGVLPPTFPLPPSCVSIDGVLCSDVSSSVRSSYPSLYYVDSTGHRLSGTDFAVGSGGTYATGMLDGALSDGREITKRWCRNALNMRDCGVGGGGGGGGSDDDDGDSAAADSKVRLGVSGVSSTTWSARRRFSNVLSLDEAVGIAKKCILGSTRRDGYSGGVINVYLIEKDEGGTVTWRRVECEDSR